MISGDAFVELAKKYCDFSAKKSILELGPGYGRILASLISKEIPYNHFTGIDISINNINSNVISALILSKNSKYTLCTPT